MTPLSAAATSFAWHFAKRAAATIVVLAILWGVYVTMVKPHTNPTPTESQKAKLIENTNFNLQPKQTFFGCCNYKINPLDRTTIKTDNKEKTGQVIDGPKGR